MTKEEIQEEFLKILEWDRKETQKVFERLRKEGKVTLDGNKKEYEYIDKETNRRIFELKKKYKNSV